MKLFNRIFFVLLLLLTINISCKCNKQLNQQLTTNKEMANKNQSSEIPFEIIFDNDRCNIKEAKNVVITSEKQLQDVYAKINMTRRPGVPVPNIDFTKQIVLGIFLGEKSTAGYQITIDKIVQNKKNIDVYYKVISPKEQAAMVITQPCVLASIPKQDLPINFIKE
jgi:cell division protein FtsI/penicillin-binding protein 2